MAEQNVTVQVSAEIQATPEQIAGLFWEMDAEQQADFFAALEGMAGVKLCFQMAAVVREIKNRSDRGDHAAQDGFQTMLAHAQAYVEAATDYRLEEALARGERLVMRACGVALLIGLAIGFGLCLMTPWSPL